MKAFIREVIKGLYVLIFLIFIFFCPSQLQAKEQSKAKAIIFVVDQIEVQELLEKDRPNIESLIQRGGFGIMNTRPEAIINTNLASTYLTLGMGTRATAPERSRWTTTYLSSGNWVVEDVKGIKNNLNGKKVERFGFFGSKIAERGLTLRLLTENPEEVGPIALMVMDNQGRVPSIKAIPQNKRDLASVLENQDIIIVDLPKGDLDQADSLLGLIVDEIGIEGNLFMVITPNPSAKALKNINLTLTPVILTQVMENNIEGILTSASTKREGLVTSLNFAPTILSFFQIQGTGEPIVIIKSKTGNSKEEILRSERLFLNLNKTRYLLHGTFIFLISIVLLLLFTNKFSSWKKENIIIWLGLIIINIPLSSIVAPLFLDYSKVFIGHLIIVFIALTITFIQKTYVKNLMAILSLSGLVTAIIILFDLFRGGYYLLDTPFGFNDVIIGGRFYGINNDLMGILLGSGLMGLFALVQYFRLPVFQAALTSSLILGAIVLSLSPLYGANVGGTIGSLVILIISLTVILDYELTIKRLVLIVGVVFIVEIGIAALDSFLNDETTHVGKLFQSVMNNGLMVLFEMIKVKVSQIGLMLVLPPWNLILFFQIYILFSLLVKGKEKLILIKEKYQYLYKGFKVVIIGALTIFAFNDTGVISSAIMLTYFLVPIGYLLLYKGEGILKG